MHGALVVHVLWDRVFASGLSTLGLLEAPEASQFDPRAYTKRCIDCVQPECAYEP